jgi:hypothetical protein
MYREQSKIKKVWHADEVKGILRNGNTRNMLIVLHAGAEDAFWSSE